MLVGRERRLLEMTQRYRSLKCVVIDAQYCDDNNQYAGSLYSYRSPIISNICFYWPEAKAGLICRVIHSALGKKPALPLPDDVDAAGLSIEGCMKLRRRWSKDCSSLVYRTTRYPHEGQPLLIESSKGPPASVHMDLLYGYDDVYEMMRDSNIHKVGCELDKLAHSLYVHYDMALVNFSNIPEVDPVKSGSNMHIDPITAFVPEAVLSDIHDRITVMIKDSSSGERA
ncbi:hypothetical protein GNI_138640 [Gregarina niphandrodes]|uniref:Uncharacterized protein n=1 Tax=Gregarina niphandrodes TaxID=110365 RepID=A0A023B0L9_GRENI|nr:hypothetical protein GNI_138640 [Gregarina niphandrodes]EZG45429.1 hypothetical protein GNI_138640 [Gregarina niphandrodes]|eukprot:XP_011132505.1 hypothetical protein GNI_138640 [Gregarina niphandrodes]